MSSSFIGSIGSDGGVTLGEFGTEDSSEIWRLSLSVVVLLVTDGIVVSIVGGNESSVMVVIVDASGGIVLSVLWVVQWIPGGCSFNPLMIGFEVVVVVSAVSRSEEDGAFDGDETLENEDAGIGMSVVDSSLYLVPWSSFVLWEISSLEPWSFWSNTDDDEEDDDDDRAVVVLPLSSV